MTENKWQIIDKLLQINFDVNTFVYCLGTNFVHSFSFLRNWSDNLIQLVLFVLDYHQWALILLLLLVPKWPYWPPNSKGLAFVKNINAILHKLLNLGFRNFPQIRNSVVCTQFPMGQNSIVPNGKLIFFQSVDKFLKFE